MNILGYLVAMANLQNLSIDGPPLKDTSLQIGTLYELTKELVSLPDFPLEGYRNGFQRHGNLAVYPSQAVRDFIFDGQGSPDDEGIIIKLHYGDVEEASKHETLYYFLHRGEVDRKIHEEVNKYIKDAETKRITGRWDKRSFLHKLIS